MPLGGAFRCPSSRRCPILSVSQPSWKFDRCAFFVVWPTFLEGTDILHQKQETFKMFRWFSQMFHLGYIKTMMFFLRFFWRFGRNSEHGQPDFIFSINQMGSLVANLTTGIALRVPVKGSYSERVHKGILVEMETYLEIIAFVFSLRGCF